MPANFWEREEGAVRPGIQDAACPLSGSCGERQKKKRGSCPRMQARADLSERLQDRTQKVPNEQAIPADDADVPYIHTGACMFDVAGDGDN